MLPKRKRPRRWRPKGGRRGDEGVEEEEGSGTNDINDGATDDLMANNDDGPAAVAAGEVCGQDGDRHGIKEESDDEVMVVYAPPCVKKDLSNSEKNVADGSSVAQERSPSLGEKKAAV